MPVARRLPRQQTHQGLQRGFGRRCRDHALAGFRTVRGPISAGLPSRRQIRCSYRGTTESPFPRDGTVGAGFGRRYWPETNVGLGALGARERLLRVLFLIIHAKHRPLPIQPKRRERLAGWRNVWIEIPQGIVNEFNK